MSTYITLSHIEVQNANCVAGVTYGFPAVTQFLGFVHALSRKLQASREITLGGCAIVSHEYQLHAYKNDKFSDYYFTQSKNPVASRFESAKAGGSPSVIQEGKMNMRVSLVIECDGFNGTDDDKIALEKYLKSLVLRHRLAGGIILSLKDVILESVEKDNYRPIIRRLLPGFVLKERNEYLLSHLEKLQEERSEATILEAWLDFSAIKYKAEPNLKEGEVLSEKTEAVWSKVEKPNKGYLIPLMVGYQAISEVYKAGEVARARDSTVPFCFVEAVYSIGEWLSPHRVKRLDEILWHYVYSDEKYLCTQDINRFEEDDDAFDDIEQYIFN